MYDGFFFVSLGCVLFIAVVGSTLILYGHSRRNKR